MTASLAHEKSRKIVSDLRIQLLLLQSLRRRKSSSDVGDAAMQPSSSSDAVSGDTSVIDVLDSIHPPCSVIRMLLVVKVRLYIPANGNKISENG